jgi:cytochrome c oxidase cbb3-type subunit 3
MILSGWYGVVYAEDVVATTGVSESRQMVNDELVRPAIRGGIVFKSYCVLCHGEKGDGDARGATLHQDINLAITPQSSVYYEKIIRLGGVGMNRSPFMPIWQDELSEEQISDVVVYLTILGDNTRRGEIVFKTNCILCHGLKGDGHGRAAKLYTPPPADLTHSYRDKQYKQVIVTLGGAAMGRSPVMPIWGQQLTKQEIQDVVSYIETLVVKE